MKRVCALGFFDGVHLGHRAIIGTALKSAEKLGLEPAVVTFDKKPKNTSAPGLINDAETRNEIIRELFLGVNIIEIPFTDRIKNTSAEEFILYLKNRLGAQAVVVGESFRFGRDAKGTPAELERAFSTDIVKTVTKDGQAVSSTAIRELIATGDIDRANAFLGHPHIISGTVSHGDERGRRLGTATVNLELREGIITPMAGVYATKTLINTTLRDSVTNFGVRPTFYENGRYLSETHIIDYSQDLYGMDIKLFLYAFLRPEKRYSSPEELRKAVENDIINAKNALKQHNKRPINADINNIN